MTSDGIAYWLQGLPDGRLTHLVRSRLGRAPRLPASFDELGVLLQQSHSCLEGLRRLDRTAVQVVAVLAEAGGRLTVGELAGRLGSDPAQVRAALMRASDTGLAWPVDGDRRWRTPAGLVPVAGPVLNRGLPYRELLPELGAAGVHELMARHGLAPARSTWDAVEILAQVLPQRLPGLLADAPAGTVDGLRRLLVDQNPPELLGWAQQNGLLLPVGDTWCVPAEVEQALRGDRAVLAAEDRPLRVDVAASAPPVAAVLALLAGARDLLAVLTETPPKPLAAGGLGVTELRRLARAVKIDLGDVVLLLQLLTAAALIGTGLRPGALTAAGRRWRLLPDDQAYIRLVRPQLHPAAVLELVTGSPSGLLMGAARSGYGLPGVRDVALAVVERGAETDASLLAHLDWAIWRRGARHVRLAAFSEPLRVLGLLGLRGQGQPAPWLAGLLAAAQQDGLLDDEEAEQDEAEQAAARTLAEHLPAAQEDIVVQADGTAYVAGRAAAGLFELLELLGARESDHTWRLSVAGVRRALDAGRTGEELLTELRRRSRHALPSVVEHLVADGARTHGRIRLHGATTVLQVGDPVLATELRHDGRLAALGLLELAPGILVSAAAPADVAAALRAAGQAPVGQGTQPPDPPPPERTRTPRRPVVQHQAWGHDAAEVVAVLRAAQRPAADRDRASGASWPAGAA